MTHLREHASAIWQSGVDAVDSQKLVFDSICVDGDSLRVNDRQFSLQSVETIEVVGAGKAGAGMVAGLEKALASLPSRIRLRGWVNVPEDCVRETQCVQLHAARPAGVNEPTEAGASGTREILQRVSALKPNDLCLVLISGGGSALLPAPVSSISLEDKLLVTRILAAAATPIEDLNLVRRELSDVKGGGLLRHCAANKVISLIVSDVIGDPLSAIASGPTVFSDAQPHRALQVLERCDPSRSRFPPAVFDYLSESLSRRKRNDAVLSPTCSAENLIIGSNSVAVAAASRHAMELGYDVIDLGSENCGTAADHGRRLLKKLMELKAERSSGNWCLLAGGETTVKLTPTSLSRKGGRNQEAVLAAVNSCPEPDQWRGLALLSGGTDGEDGPTDAAGAIADQQLMQRYAASDLDSSEFLRINNSYPFFDRLDGLIRTGPTHTNVMDLAVGIVEIPTV